MTLLEYQDIRDDKPYFERIIQGFKNCEEQDFRDKGYSVDEEFKKEIPNLLCPNNTEYKHQYAASNSFSNKTRRHFGIEMILCSSDFRPDCKPFNVTSKFLSEYSFTIWML